MSTAHDTVEMVVDNILQLLPQVIKMPRQESEFRKLADEFYKYGYPNVVGALDGTGIKVTVPASDKNDYFTYKYSTNINLTALCDAKKETTEHSCWTVGAQPWFPYIQMLTTW